MAFKLFAGKKQDNANDFIALDIGTEVVKVLVCRQEDGIVKVLAAAKTPQIRSSFQAGMIKDLKTVTQTVSTTLAKVLAASPIKPVRVITGISGEHVKSIRIALQYVRPDAAAVISLNELKNLAKHLQWKSHDKVRRTLVKELNKPELDVKLIHAAVLDFKVDGQTVADPLHFAGRELWLNTLNSYAPLTQIKALEQVLGHLKLTQVGVLPQAFAVANSLGSLEDSDAIVIDIGGGTTDVAVVRNGNIEGTVSFGLAGRSFTQKLANTLGLDIEEAERVKIAYGKGLLDTPTSKKLAKLLLEDATVWLTGVGIALAEFSETETLPAKIYICGGGSLLPEIAEVLKSDWYEKHSFAKPPSVVAITPSMIQNIEDSTGSLTEAFDITPLALASSFVSEARGSKFSQFLQKTI
jgi:cell division protein FtsA